MQTHELVINGTKITLRLMFHTKTGTTQWNRAFEATFGSELEAALYFNDFCARQDAYVKQMRRIAYEAGWKDAKSHQAKKKTDFNPDSDSGSSYIGY